MDGLAPEEVTVGQDWLRSTRPDKHVGSLLYEDEIRSVQGLGVQFLSPSQTSSVFLR